MPENGITRVVDHMVAMMCRFKIIGSTEFQERLQKVSEGDPEIMAEIMPTPQVMDTNKTTLKTDVNSPELSPVRI